MKKLLLIFKSTSSKKEKLKKIDDILGDKVSSDKTLNLVNKYFKAKGIDGETAYNIFWEHTKIFINLDKDEFINVEFNTSEHLIELIQLNTFILKNTSNISSEFVYSDSLKGNPRKKTLDLIKSNLILNFKPIMQNMTFESSTKFKLTNKEMKSLGFFFEELISLSDMLPKVQGKVIFCSSGFCNTCHSYNKDYPYHLNIELNREKYVEVITDHAPNEIMDFSYTEINLISA